MTYVFPVPRHRRLTPARCKVLSRRSDRLVNGFEQRGITVPQSSRLRREVRLLEGIANGRAFPADQKTRLAVGNAARDAHEFEAIGKLVGRQRALELAADLQQALDGTPERLEKSRTPYRFQSQLWISSVFHSAGVALKRPKTTATKSPDFLIDIGATTYGLEVKRPLRGDTAIRRAVRDAVDQLREYGVIGGVALDVSDCLPQTMLQQYRADRNEPPYALTDADFQKLYRGAEDLLIDSECRKILPYINSIFFLIVYATGWRWFNKGPSGPELFAFHQFGTFVTTKGNLAYWHADAIRKTYERGLKKIGLFVTRESYEQI